MGHRLGLLRRAREFRNNRHRPGVRSLSRALVAAAAIAAPASGQTWQGAVVTPDGEIEAVLKMWRDDGRQLGRLDVPAQGIAGAELVDLTRDEHAVRFRVALPGAPEETWPAFELKERAGDLSGTMSQAGSTMIASFGRVSDIAKTGREQEPALPLAYRSEDITLPVTAPAEIEGEAGEELLHELAGTLTLPDVDAHGPGPYPAVVLLTGSGPQDRDETIAGHKPFSVLSDRLTKAGIAVLRCDDRGYGLSGGSFIGSTMTERSEDARASLRWLAEREEIRAGAIGLLGHSEGGIIASMIAGGDAGEEQSGDGVAFVVLLASPTVPGEALITEQGVAMLRASGAPEEQIQSVRATNAAVFRARIESENDEEMRERIAQALAEHMPDLPGQARAGLVDRTMVQMDDPWLMEFLVFDPAAEMEGIDEPVLAVFGELDLQVLPSQNEQPARDALAGNPDATIEVREGLNHLFQPAQTGLPAEYGTIETTFDEDTMALIASWINERFGG